LDNILYQLYGFNIVTSEIPLLRDYHSICESSDLPTVSVKTASRIKLPASCQHLVQQQDTRFMFVSDDECYIDSKDNHRLVVNKGGILVQNREGNNSILFEEIMGPDLILLSRIYGRAILHGSAFLYNDRAFLVIAPSGVGKSTLTSAIVNHQLAHFITDDIISVDIENNIFNGLHIVSLNMDSANRIDFHRNKTCAFSSLRMDEKIGFQMKPVVSSKTPIGGVFFLQPHNSTELIAYEKINPFSAFQQLIKNTKMQNTLTSSLFKQELHVLEHLAFSVPAYTLSVIHDYTQLQSVTQEVIQLLERVTT
jgi:hypothetical protein